MAEQYTFTVNGKRVSTSKQTSMLRFLRDELHLHSVKDGCSEGTNFIFILSRMGAARVPAVPA